MNKQNVRTAKAFVLVHRNQELWSNEVFVTERTAKTRFSQCNGHGLLYKNQNEVQIERLISESVVEKALNRILEINQDNPNFAIESVIERLREELK